MAVGDAFALDGEQPLGVVVVHGFTGTPFEVRYLAERINQAGFPVRVPRLPGHGTSLDDLDRTTWQDWVDCVDAAVEGMATERVAVVGQSLGGLLALHLAATRPLACVASLAAPLWLEGLGAKVARWSRGRRSIHIPKLGGSDVLDAQAKRDNPCYPAIPTRALGQLVDFMGVVDRELDKITIPRLVIHAEQDHTAPVACAQRIGIGAERVVILPRSYHLIAVDVERDAVALEVIAFLEKHACGT